MGMRLLLLQLQISVAVLVVLALRIGMRKLPKIYSYGLWVLVFARLLCPIQLESRLSFMPSMAESTLWLEQSLFRFTGGEQISLPENDVIVAQMGTQSEEDSFAVGGQNLLSGVDSNKSASGMPNPDPGIMPEIHAQTAVESERENRNGIENGAGSTDMDGGGSFGIDYGTYADSNNDAGVTGEGKYRALFLLWLLGCGGILFYNGAVLVRVRRRLRDAGHFAENVYISENIKTPFTLGLLRPRIFLPAVLGPDEQEYILCHERVHIKRKDYLVKNLAFLVTAVYWFNPFVWTAFYFLERDMEMACDEKVIRLMGNGIKRQYSQSLLNFAQGRDGAWVTPFAFGENGVKQRVKNVLSYDGVKKWSIVLGILILLAAAATFFTVRSEDGQPLDDQPFLTESGSGSAESAGNTGFLVEAAQSDVRMALERWAEAFIDRDGETLWQLSYDKEAFAAWELVEMQGEKIVSFGYTDPWPRQGSRITWQEGDDTALIRYYVVDSLTDSAAPMIFVADESVNITWEEDLCYIDHVQMKTYDNIGNREQFEELYGQENYDFTYENTGYSASYYRALVRHAAEAENTEASQWNDSGHVMFEYPVPEKDSTVLSQSSRVYPDSAAVSLLHLGPGTASVEYEGVPMSVEDWDISWLKQTNWMGEGSRAYVTYTFKSGGSQVVIPMELIEASAGIWAPVGSGGIRQVYQTRSGAPYNLGAEGEVFVQTSQYGIYLLGRWGLHCVYPYYIPENVSWTIDDWKLYFDVDSQYKEGYLDYRSDSICVLDLQTGEFDREALPLPVDQPQFLYVYGGFLHLQYGNHQYHEPLVNTGNGPLRNEIWNGKTAVELTEGEEDAYAAAVRRQLLENPGTLLDLSNRTMEETFVLVDLDGDGHAERVCLSADPDQVGQYELPYDTWRLTLNDNGITGWSDRLYNNIWAVSLDGEEILLAIYEDGPSGDPKTTLFRAVEGRLQEVGSFPADITVCSLEKNVITGAARIDVIQTDWAYYRWQISDSGELELAKQEQYDFLALNDVELLVELPVHNSPGGEKSHLMQPQTVKLVMTDESMQWVYLLGETGDGGWFLMGEHLTVADLDEACDEVFDGLQFMD